MNRYIMYLSTTIKGFGSDTFIMNPINIACVYATVPPIFFAALRVSSLKSSSSEGVNGRGVEGCPSLSWRSEAIPSVTFFGMSSFFIFELAFQGT